MKNQSPYDQYDDLQLLLRYNKLKNEQEEHIFNRDYANLPTDDQNRLTVAIKIDKVVFECYIRGLMAPNSQESTLSLKERHEIVKQALNQLKKNFELINYKESPHWETLTPKAQALKPWNHLPNQYHQFIHYAKKEDPNLNIEELRLESSKKTNEMIEKLRNPT